MTTSAWGLLLAFSSGVAGFAALSLAMDRHFEDCHGRGTSPGPRRRWLCVGGALALAVSLGACITNDGAAQGWVLWFGALTVSALAVVSTASYAPRRLVQLLQTAGALAVLSLVAGVAGR